MIDRDQVLHIARLARLRLSEDEIEHLTNQLGSILGYVDQLNAIDTNSVEPTSLVSPSCDPLRDDVEVPSLPIAQVLQNGPSVKKDHFAIPKVIGEG